MSTTGDISLILGVWTLKIDYIGYYLGSIKGAIKGETRNLDYSSSEPQDCCSFKAWFLGDCWVRFALLRRKAKGLRVGAYVPNHWVLRIWLLVLVLQVLGKYMSIENLDPQGKGSMATLLRAS